MIKTILVIIAVALLFFALGQISPSLMNTAVKETTNLAKQGIDKTGKAITDQFTPEVTCIQNNEEIPCHRENQSTIIIEDNK